MKFSSEMSGSNQRRPKRRLPITCPPLARIPCEPFYSELVHAGSDNTIYVKVQSEPYRSRRQIFMARLFNEYNENPHTPIPLEEIVPHMFVVIHCNDTFGSLFFRAQVLRVDETQMVHCFKTDEGSEVSVVPDQVYRITQELLEAEVTVLKCFLDGLGLFDGLPDIHLAFHILRMSDVSPEPFYPSKIVRHYKGTPVIRILWKDDLTLTSAVQKWITYVCSIPELKVGDEMEGTVVHVNSSAEIWLQPNDKTGLVCRIQEMLQRVDYSKVPRAFGIDPSQNGRYNPRRLETMDRWKRKFFTIPTGVYISRYHKDNSYYRCILKRSINKERVEVEFLDFGNTEIVPRQGIVNCKDVDENLGYIPPMCIKTKLYGLTRINEDRFCKQINETVVAKVVTEAEDEDGDAAVEVYNHDSVISVNQEILCSSSSHEMEVDNSERDHEAESARYHHYDYLM